MKFLKCTSPWVILLSGLLSVFLGCGTSSPNIARNNSSQTNAAESKPKFEISVKEQEGVRLCTVTFSGELPPPTEVDKILRNAVEKLVNENAKKDVLAHAYLGDDELTSNQYSGDLVYKASKKKIMTMDEFNGVKTSTSSNNSYFVQTEEQHTLPGVTPKRTWLSITLVYPKAPPHEEAYNALISEIEKLSGKGVDVNAYVSVGDKKVKTSWNQLRDDDGAFVFADYSSDRRQITRKGRLLKKR